MEQFQRGNTFDNAQGFQPTTDSEFETEAKLPKVMEKIQVEESPPDTECGSTNPGGSDYQGPGLAEAVLDEDQADLPLNAVIRSKKYSKITDEQRRDLIDAVENNGEKIIHAAKRFNINYSSAKSILNVFKSEGRSLKKLTRQRNPKEGDLDDNDEEEKNPEDSGSFQLPQKLTNEISTQTEPEGEPQEENHLLALRDRLLAFKTEKRENPYSNLITHEATRYPENLSEFPQHQMANSDLSSYISLQGTPGSQNSLGGDAKCFMPSQPLITNFGPQQQYVSGIQAQLYQQQPTSSLYLGNQDFKNDLVLNMRGQAQQQSGNRFSLMSYTGTNQAQYTINQASDNQKTKVHYIQPIMYVMPSASGNQLNFGSSIFQNIQNFAPHQNTYLYYSQNQNRTNEEDQNQNSRNG